MPVIVKLEKPVENNGGVQHTKEESDSFKENVKPVKAEVKENKLEPKDLKDVNSNTERTVLEPERIEFCVSVKTPQEVVERTAEESEKLKNDQQAKIPLKKREIKLTDDYDSPLKGPLRKCITPTKDVVKEEGKQEEETFKRVPTITDGKFLVNGELGSERIMPNNKLEHFPSTTEDPTSLSVEKNGIGGEKAVETVSTIVRTSDVERSILHMGKEAAGVIAEVSCQKVPLKEDTSPPGKESLHDGKTSEKIVEAPSKMDDGLKKPEESVEAKESVPHPKASLDKSSKAPSPKELITPAEEEGLKSKDQPEEKPDAPREEVTPSPAPALPSDKPVAEKEGSDSTSTLPSQESKVPEAQDSRPQQDSAAVGRETPKLDHVQSSVEEPSEAKKESLKSKCKYKLISEEEGSLTENREITSERQKDGIKLTIRISSRKKADPLSGSQPLKTQNAESEKDGEVVSVGRILRRSPRISKPTPKLVDQKPEKKRSEEEEEKPVPVQKHDKKEDSKKQEKEMNSKNSKVKYSGERSFGSFQLWCLLMWLENQNW